MYTVEISLLQQAGLSQMGLLINAYLCGVGVDSHFRNRGIGTEICRRLLMHCFENNLHTQLFCEDNLVPYYEKVGLEKFTIGMRVKEKNAM
ncbi:GNAT family N-acetyltransferase [Clostridium botulinum]|uniref:GNAT family N-acetyltransferase n=2 Tax=Clostridium botulinum TaxID=1491 RepID=UPI0028FC1AD5|nr:GNAT family N-acetyltransferase [Clostridium botulinum]